MRTTKYNPLPTGAPGVLSGITVTGTDGVCGPKSTSAQPKPKSKLASIGS